MKRKVSLITTSLVIAAFSVSSVFAAKSVSDLNKEKQQIQKKVTQTEEELKTTQSEKSALLVQIETLDDELEVVMQELYKLETELAEVEESLAQNEDALEKATLKREEQYETLKNRIRVMYESGDMGYLEVVMNAEGFSDMIKRMEYINNIMDYDKNMFDEFKETEDLITEKVESIRIDKERLEELTEAQRIKKEDLDLKISEKNQFVYELTKKEETFLQQIEEMENESKEITNLIIKAQAAASSNSSGKVYASSSGAMQHPVPAYSGWAFNDSYGRRVNPISGKNEFHTGLDLKATLGTDIVAAEAGTVIYSGNRGGYGKCVIVDHGGGVTTLYGHNSALVVSVGQSVQRGQVIAKAGSTGYSTGVHCHFEVRINGAPDDPRKYI